MSNTPERAPDPLESAAREIAEHLTLYGATEKDVADALAILRRHRLRGPAPDPDREALVNFIVSVRDQLDDAIHEGGVPPTDMEIADALNSAARALAAPERQEWQDAIAPEGA